MSLLERQSELSETHRAVQNVELPAETGDNLISFLSEQQNQL